LSCTLAQGVLLAAVQRKQSDCADQQHATMRTPREVRGECARDQHQGER